MYVNKVTISFLLLLQKQRIPKFDCDLEALTVKFVNTEPFRYLKPSGWPRGNALVCHHCGSRSISDVGMRVGLWSTGRIDFSGFSQQ